MQGIVRRLSVYPVEMKEEPYWAGSNNNLINPFNSGNFKYEVYDSAVNSYLLHGLSVLFSRNGRQQQKQKALTEVSMK